MTDVEPVFRVRPEASVEHMGALMAALAAVLSRPGAGAGRPAARPSAWAASARPQATWAPTGSGWRRP